MTGPIPIFGTNNFGVRGAGDQLLEQAGQVPLRHEKIARSSAIDGLTQLAADLTKFTEMLVTAWSAGCGGNCGNTKAPRGMPDGFGPIVQPFSATMPANNQMSVNIGDGNRLEIDERSSQMTIIDAEGNRTRIWGDPHVEVNGKHIGDFYDTTTFVLKNGTKITVNTEAWQGNPNQYVASQIVITRGNQGMVIDGVSQNKLGDLSVRTGDGQALDTLNRDGFTVNENNLGNRNMGWTSEFTGERISQKDFDITRHANRDQLDAAHYNRDMGNAMMSWLFFGDLGGIASLAGSETGREISRKLTERLTGLPSEFMTQLVTTRKSGNDEMRMMPVPAQRAAAAVTPFTHILAPAIGEDTNAERNGKVIDKNGLRGLGIGANDLLGVGRNRA